MEFSPPSSTVPLGEAIGSPARGRWWRKRGRASWRPPNMPNRTAVAKADHDGRSATKARSPMPASPWTELPPCPWRASTC